MRNPRLRVVAVALTALWVIGGGFNVAYASMPGMRMGPMNPAAWMRGGGGMAAMSGMDMGVSPAPASPITCRSSVGAVSGLGGSLGGPLAGGPGLAGLLFAQKAKPTPSPTISPMPTTVPGLVSGIGPMPKNVTDAELRAVTDNIICQCGCELTVTACEFSMPCDVSPKMRYQAAVWLSQGLTPQQTLDRFGQVFGEKVLAAPPKEGAFNMTIWLLPVAGLVLGGALVGWAIVSWKRQAPAGEQIAPETDADMLSRIDDEVKKGL